MRYSALYPRRLRNLCPRVPWAAFLRQRYSPICHPWCAVMLSSCDIFLYNRNRSRSSNYACLLFFLWLAIYSWRSLLFDLSLLCLSWTASMRIYNSERDVWISVCLMYRQEVQGLFDLRSKGDEAVDSVVKENLHQKEVRAKKLTARPAIQPH